MKKLIGVFLTLLMMAGLAQAQPVVKVRLFDTNYSHYLTLAWNEDRAANQILNFITGAADRTITLSGNPTLADWFDQAVKAASSPTFAGMTLTGFSGAVSAAAGVLSAATLTVPLGGTGATALTDHGILLGSGAGAITPMAVLAAGELIYGVAGADPAALAAGATTTILVGGGAAAPIWTTATGTGAPVRAGSPTFTGTPVAPTIDLTNITDGYVPYMAAAGAGFADSAIRANANVVAVGGAAAANAGVYIYGDTTTGATQYKELVTGVMTGTDNSFMSYVGGEVKAATAVTNWHGLYVANAGINGGSTITNQYQIYIDTPTRGGTLNYSIYSAGGNNYFGGDVIVGASASITTPATTNLTLDPTADLIFTPASNLVKTTTGVRIQSDNYASQTTGWGISYAGAGDFRYLYADELHAKAFIADLEQALAGGQIICKSVAPLAAVFTIPAAGANATLVVESFKGFDTFKVFVDGDFVRLRQFDRTGTSLTISNCWGTVAWVSTDTTAKTQTYTFTRSAAPNAGTASGTIGIGVLALDYGTTGNGFLESTAIDGAMADNAPYHQIVSWATHPNSGLTVRTRLGNLKGIFSVSNEYGLYAGAGILDASQYLRISDQAAELHNLSIKMFDGATNTILMSPTAPSFALGSPLPTAYGTGAGVWMGKDTTYKFRVGDPAGGKLAWDGTTLTAAGWTIGATAIQDTAGTVGMSSAVTGGDDIRFWAGHATPASAPFRVTEAGAVTATSATITGAITANTGYIGGTGGWTIAANTISATNAKLWSDGTQGYVYFGTVSGVGHPTYGDVGAWMGTIAAVPKFSLYANASNYLQYDGTNLTFKSPNVTINSTGISVLPGTGAAVGNAYSFSNAYSEVSGMMMYRFDVVTAQTVTTQSQVLDADGYTTAYAQLRATATSGATARESRIYLTAKKDATVTQNFVVDAGATGASDGMFLFSGGAISQASLTDGYIPYHVSDAAGLANSSLSLATTTLTQTGQFIVNNTAAAQAMFHGYSTLYGGAHASVGEIDIGYTAGYMGRIQHTTSTFSFDHTWDSAAAVTQFRMRTAGTPVVAMTILGTGSVLVNAAAAGAIGARFESTGVSTQYAAAFYGVGAAGSNSGVYIDAGTNSSDYGLVVNQSGSATDLAYVRGDGYGYLYDTAWHYGPSNRSLKTNIKPVGASLGLIGKLKPSTFDYKDGRKGYVGFIAEDMAAVFPSLVSVEKDGTYSLKTTDLIPYTIVAIQELNATITAQVVEIELLKKAIADMQPKGQGMNLLWGEAGNSPVYNIKSKKDN